jgi:hypothetical protein
MERKPIVETYQPRRLDADNRTYVPQPPTPSAAKPARPQASQVVARPSVNKD